MKHSRFTVSGLACAASLSLLQGCGPRDADGVRWHNVGADDGVTESELYINVVVRDSGKLYSAHNAIRYRTTITQSHLGLDYDCLFCRKRYTDYKILRAGNVYVRIGKGDSVVMLLPSSTLSWLQSMISGTEEPYGGTEWVVEEVGAHPNPQFDYDRNHDGYKDRWQYGGAPYFVTMKDVNDPATMRLANPYKLRRAFHRKVSLVSVTVSRTPVGELSTLETPWIKSLPIRQRGERFPLDITRDAFLQWGS
jgi:hypothetical protein